MDRIAPFHLKTLVTIGRLGTFQAAAEHLNMTQPAISARMRELELQLGSVLFQREGRRMTLTARARQLVLEAEPVLASLEEVLLNAAARSYATGVVRIGTGEIASASCLPAFIRQVQASFPAVTLEIKVDLTARMLEDLLAGKSDMVFLAGPVAHPGIRTTSLGSLELVWLTAPEMMAEVANGDPMTIWSLPAHSPVHHVVRDVLEQQDIPYQSLSTCNNVRTLIDVVAQGGGMGLFPETMVRAEMGAGRLTEVLARPQIRIEFQSAIRKRETDPLILRLFEYTESLDIDSRRSLRG